MFSQYIKYFVGVLLVVHAGVACGVNIFQAVKNGDVETLTRILNSNPGAISDTEGPFKSMPLHVAAHCGQVEALRLLLGRGADVNARDTFLRTPLHEAILQKHASAVQCLVEHGADREAKDFMKKSPLYVAAARQLIEVVKLLVDSGAQVDSGWGEHELTPLHRAADNGDYDTAVFLVLHGADVNAEANHCADYATPLEKAIQGSNIDLVKFLIHYGATVVAYECGIALEKQLQSRFPGYDWRVDRAEFEHARKESLMDTFAFPGVLAKLILDFEGVGEAPKAEIESESEGDGYSSGDTE